MDEASEADRLKEAFRAVDKANTGFFSRDDLAKVFKELEAWSQEDLDELFDAVDPKKTGKVNYTALINYIFHGDDDVDEEGGEEDSDDDDADAAAMLEECAELNLDLEQRMTLDMWTQVMSHLDVDAGEAETMYRYVAKELEERGERTARGIPVREFLDDLDITVKDHESLRHLDAAIDAMLSKKAPPDTHQHALNIAVSSLALELRKRDLPASEAWQHLQASKGVSHNGKVVVQNTFSNDKSGLVQLVDTYMRQPPLLPAAAGQAANRDHCIETVDKLIAQCRSSRQKFTDLEWNLEANPAECLYVDKTGPGWDCTVAEPAGYKRLRDLVPHPVLFKGGIRAGDIKQGRIGTCFLLGALGAVAANKEDAITKAFVRYDVELGIYGVRFCVDGEWTFVVVDDIMPLDKHGRLLYARSSDPDELWAPLLEKAYCKLNTCYEMCDGGRPGQAIYHLCGGTGGKFSISDAHKKDPKSYFALMRNAVTRGWLLTSTFVIVKTEAKAGVGKCGEAVLPTGLVGGHVYSVLRLVDAGGTQLVQCRNPWGTGEWKGKFSDANEHGEWTPELREATGWTGANDGKFWMCIEDFVVHSAGVEYARTFGPQWKKQTVVQHFPKGPVKATAQWAFKGRSANELTFNKGDTLEIEAINPGWWRGNVAGSPDTVAFFPGNYVKLQDQPVARYDFAASPAAGPQEEPMTAVIVLSQPNVKLQRKFYKRQKDGKNYKDITYQNIEVVVIGPDGKVALRRSGKKRSVSGDLVIKEPGSYKIYATSLGGNGSQFSLRAIVKGGSSTLSEVPNAHISEVPLA